MDVERNLCEHIGKCFDVSGWLYLAGGMWVGCWRRKHRHQDRRWLSSRKLYRRKLSGCIAVFLLGKPAAALSSGGQCVCVLMSAQIITSGAEYSLAFPFAGFSIDNGNCGPSPDGEGHYSKDNPNLFHLLTPDRARRRLQAVAAFVRSFSSFSSADAGDPTPGPGKPAARNAGLPGRAGISGHTRKHILFFPLLSHSQYNPLANTLQADTVSADALANGLDSGHSGICVFAKVFAWFCRRIVPDAPDIARFLQVPGNALLNASPESPRLRFVLPVDSWYASLFRPARCIGGANGAALNPCFGGDFEWGAK